jgi:hypothetical protein
MNSGQVGGDEPDDEGPMLDFSDPSTINNLNGMSHDRQHVYINPQNLPNNIPNPIPNPIPLPAVQNTSISSPLPPNPGLRTPGQMPPPPVPEIPVMNIPLTQDMVARGLHLLHLQTQVAQEKLEYLRRREAREVSEFTQRKDAVDKANITRHKFERAIVCYLLLRYFFISAHLIFFAFAGPIEQCTCRSQPQTRYYRISHKSHETTIRRGLIFVSFVCCVRHMLFYFLSILVVIVFSPF